MDKVKLTMFIYKLLDNTENECVPNNLFSLEGSTIEVEEDLVKDKIITDDICNVIIETMLSDKEFHIAPIIWNKYGRTLKNETDTFKELFRFIAKKHKRKIYNRLKTQYSIKLCGIGEYMLSKADSTEPIKDITDKLLKKELKNSKLITFDLVNKILESEVSSLKEHITALKSKKRELYIKPRKTFNDIDDITTYIKSREDYYKVVEDISKTKENLTQKTNSLKTLNRNKKSIKDYETKLLGFRKLLMNNTFTISNSDILYTFRNCNLSEYTLRYCDYNVQVKEIVDKNKKISELLDKFTSRLVN